MEDGFPLSRVLFVFSSILMFTIAVGEKDLRYLAAPLI